MAKKTVKINKSFFDYSDKEKKEIIDHAAMESNRMQKEVWDMAKKTTWEDKATEIFYHGDDITYSEFMSFIRSEKEKSRREVIEEIGKFLRKHEEHIGWFEVHKDNWQAFKSHLKGGKNGF